MPAAKKAPAPRTKRPPSAKPDAPQDAAPSAKPDAPQDAAPSANSYLRKTEWAGVFTNPAGDHVDERGVLLAFTALRAKIDVAETEILGTPATTPAEVLKLAALNPRLPLMIRLDAAKAAAPYYDRKRPLGVDAGENPDNPTGPGLPLGNLADLRGLKTEELKALHALLKKAHV